MKYLIINVTVLVEKLFIIFNDKKLISKRLQQFLKVFINEMPVHKKTIWHIIPWLIFTQYQFWISYAIKLLGDIFR